MQSVIMEDVNSSNQTEIAQAHSNTVSLNMAKI